MYIVQVRRQWGIPNPGRRVHASGISIYAFPDRHDDIFYGNWLDFIVGVEMNLCRVWGIEIGLVLVWGPKLTWFLCVGVDIDFVIVCGPKVTCV